MMRPGPLLSLQRKPDGFPPSPKGQNPRRAIRHLSGTIHATRKFIRDKRITSSNSMKNMMTGLRAMRDGSQLIGWGMATQTYPGQESSVESAGSSAAGRQSSGCVGVRKSGPAWIRSYPRSRPTSGISPDLVDARLGDTNYPEAPISSGSMSTASVGPPCSRPPCKPGKDLSWAGRRGSTRGRCTIPPVHPYILPALKKWNSKAEKYF
jgi:hypothetical protein